MKRNYLTLVAILLGAFGASAQIGEIPTNYWTSFEANYATYDSWWEVDDKTTNIDALVNLTPSNGMNVEASSISNNAYTITTDNDVFKIDYNKTTSYEKFGFSWMNWAYPEDCASDNWQLVNPITGEAWTDNCHRTAKGYSVDFSDPANRVISFKYQAIGNDPINLRVDLWDIKGRKTTKAGYICTDGLERTSTYMANDENAWQDFAILYADESSEDVSELEEEILNSYFYGYAGNTLADGNNTWWNGIQFANSPTFNLLVDSSRIIGIEIYVNCDVTTSGQKSTIYMKDLTIGNTITRNENPTEFKTGIATISENNEIDIQNGVVYSDGKIEVLNITGQKVKSASFELNINDLPTGIYFIKTAEGTARFIK